jgi:hypothetical protein
MLEFEQNSQLKRRVKNELIIFQSTTIKTNFLFRTGSLPYAILQKHTRKKWSLKCFLWHLIKLLKMKRRLVNFDIETYINENIKNLPGWKKI